MDRKGTVTKLLLLLLVSVLCLTSCIKGEDAKKTIGDFLCALEAEDYEAAASMMHPDTTVNLESYIKAAEKEKEIDFREGVEILRYSSVSSSHYNSTVEGSQYETTLRAKIGEKEIDLTFKIVDNDNGYGVLTLLFGEVKS